MSYSRNGAIGGGGSGGGNVTGSGASGLVTLWSGTNTIIGDPSGTWSGTGHTFVIGSPTFNARDGHFTGPAGASVGPSSAGGGFTNQPAGDTVTFVSSDAGDTTQQVTIIGVLAGVDASENILLNGVTPVTSVGTYDKVLALVLNGACVGTVTASETSGGLTITTIAPAALSAGLQTFGAIDGYGKVLQIVASGATTKTVGIGGYAIGGGIQREPVVLTGTTKVNTTNTWEGAVQFYLGDLEATRTVTLNSIAGFDFRSVAGVFEPVEAGSLAASNLTPGQVLLASAATGSTGATSITGDTGLTYSGTGASFKLNLLGSVTFGGLAGLTISGATHNQNILLGESGNLTMTGNNNRLMSDYAGNALTSGSDNTLFGQYAGLGITTGSWNIGLGGNTLAAVTTHNGNVAIGRNAAQALDSDYNTMIGFGAGASTTTGANNLMFGAYAGTANTTGYSGTFLGYSAGTLNTTGAENTFVGDVAGQSNTTGSSNVFIGPNAGGQSVSGNANVAVGVHAALGVATSGSDTNSTVDNNMTFLGSYASRSATVPTATPLSNSTAVGYGAQVAASNTVVLGNASVTEVQMGTGGVAGVKAATMSLGLGAVTPPTALTVGDTATTSPRGIMSWQSNTGTDGARLHLRKSRGTFASPTTVVTGDTLGRVVATGYDGTGFLEMAGINFLSTGTIGTNRLPTQIQFQTATDASPSVLTTALTINEKQQALFPAGTVAAPSLVIGATGVYESSGPSLRMSSGGAGKSSWGVGSFDTYANNGSFSAGAALDTILSRRAAATWNFGAPLDSPTPIAQTLTFQGSRGGTDTNVAGVVATVQGSLGTGSAVPGPLSLRTGYPTASGTTQHVASTRVYVPGAWTTLTESTDTAIATLTFGASSVIGARLFVTVEANDGTDYQGMSYEVQVNSSRKATGNTISTIGVIGTPPVASGTGTLTATFTVTEGAAAVTINCNATSSLTQTTLRTTFQEISNGPGVTVAQL